MIISGSAQASTTAAMERSTKPFTSFRAPRNSGASTWISGSPATGRVWIRGPATSVNAGAKTRSMSVPSNCQPRRRNRVAVNSAEPVTATVSASAARAASRMPLNDPTTGTSPRRCGTGANSASGIHAPTT